MASLFMRFAGGKAKALTLSYDDGVEQDVRLLEIMDKHGLKGTFNLNSGEYSPEGTVFEKGRIHRRLSEAAVTELYGKNGHEVAVHGLTHPFLEQLPQNACVYEICEDRKRLEKQFGTIVRGMAYPFGTYSDEVVEVLKNNGIVYARTVWSSNSFDIPTNWLRLRPTCHHDEEKFEELTDKFINEAPERAPWLFYLWGHSYEFEQNNNWSRIEGFAEKIGGRDDIWYANNIEIYDYIEAFNRLRFSMDMSRVFNPTSTELFFCYNEKEYCCKPGMSLELN